MRIDYALYGLAIVLFALTAITLAYVGLSEGFLYAAATAIVGLLALGGGYFLRPKATPPATVQTTATEAPEPDSASTIATAEPVQQIGGPIVEAPATTIQVASKTETPLAEATRTQVVSIAELPKAKTPPTEGPPVAIAPPNHPVESATPAAPSGKSEFTKIRGISENRAQQLKAVGIETVKDLANASASDLAEKLNVSPRIVKMWIGTAKKLAK